MGDDEFTALTHFLFELKRCVRSRVENWRWGRRACHFGWSLNLFQRTQL